MQQLDAMPKLPIQIWKNREKNQSSLKLSFLCALKIYVESDMYTNNDMPSFVCAYNTNNQSMDDNTCSLNVDRIDWI